MSKQNLGSTTIVQVGIIVADIEAAARAWSEILDLPMPTIRITDAPEFTHAEHRGQPTAAQAKLAFFDTGQCQLELIEPIGGPSTWREQLDEHGASLHHVAFRIKGMGDTVAYLEGKGVPLVQRGEYKGGRYAYLDGIAKLGAVIELLEND